MPKNQFLFHNLIARRLMSLTEACKETAVHIFDYIISFRRLKAVAVSVKNNTLL